MQPLILRNYRASDATAVSQLFREVYGDLYVQPHVYLPQMINQNHADQRWHSLVAELDGQIRGHATLFRDTGARTAELALSAVHPDARGQNIATRLSQQLLSHAQALGCHSVSIKQVTHHPYTQRMAANLGFHNTGLLPDYVPSPFGSSTPESIVMGCRIIDGYKRPLPRQTWPSGYRSFMEHLSDVFGTHEQRFCWRGPAIQLERHTNRYDIRLKNLRPDLLEQLRGLPQQWMVSIRLGLSQQFTCDLNRLTAIGFVFTGLAPVEGKEGGWLALFHRGYRLGKLELHCSRMQHLHDQAQQQVVPRLSKIAL
ncbi:MULTISPECIES: GNAT family N-acetyltransferase [unclassified Pseudomonas]|uniref:GNAT family N-acetyltransferase n=1 Tax=unclassified Pseudomonas TaxID=196821 RepID=UPI001B321E81|nr:MULTISPECIES: GNAT family N-acetyltransferase [unclassified Pseudomonas]MBP5946809.1 GNAT family N-acetyltransferase [Pseudomonas sp. P9(2020)]MBZ9564947.1 GNAT family N-acetyltransferase [Pseudomonas sp. P116]